MNPVHAIPYASDLLAACRDEPALFPYGVGANDMTSTTADVWTQTGAQRVAVLWSTDATFQTNTHRATVSVSPDHDGTVLFPVSGLYVMRSPLDSPANRFAISNAIAFSTRSLNSGTLPPQNGHFADTTTTRSGGGVIARVVRCSERECASDVQ